MWEPVCRRSSDAGRDFSFRTSLRQKKGHPQGKLTDAEFIARYEEESGAKIEHYSFLRLIQIFKLVCVLTASAQTIPSFEEFWERNWSELMAVWDECRVEYGG
jgi:aminoglycoside phosphotransferase (APT) family kinase protein